MHSRVHACMPAYTQTCIETRMHRHTLTYIHADIRPLQYMYTCLCVITCIDTYADTHLPMSVYHGAHDSQLVFVSSQQLISLAREVKSFLSGLPDLKHLYSKSVVE